MGYQHIKVPAEGDKITANADMSLNVPDRPIIPFIEGDGIGVDITPPMLKVVNAAVEKAYGSKKAISWMEIYAGEKATHVYGSDEWLPAETLEAMREFLIGIKGPLTTPVGGGIRSLNVAMRQELDLFLCLRPIHYFRGVPSPVKHPELTEMVIFRENTEGAYVGAGGNLKIGTADEVAIQEEIHTRKGVERIIRAAFAWAREHGRKKVLMADKSNVMQHAHGLWQRCYEEVAADYPDIEAQHMFADALAMQMVRKPHLLDVVVTNNMFGDILSDLGAALQGGLGLAASANLHPGRTSMFEPVHGSAPKYAGTGKANPLAAILSAALMLDFLGHREASERVEQAVADALKTGRTTVDLGGDLSTSGVGDRIARTVAE